jgi:patatin-like phospholipase/acyl hydrolase
MCLTDGQILREISRACGKEIHEMFDMVAGTSTGAIVASMIG